MPRSLFASPAAPFLVSLASLTLLAGAPSLALAQSGQTGEQTEDEAAKKSLSIGDPMPALDASDELEWYNLEASDGEKITEWKDGHVYVLDFWATWCGPCIAAMPHMIETQEKYADQNVHVVGVHVWGSPQAPSVSEFLENAPERNLDFNYPMARETGDWAARTYMEAAGQSGIPTIMIVDQEGVLSWIGHPMDMDQPLAQIVAGEFDREEAIAKQRLQQRAGEALQSEEGRAIIAELENAMIDGEHRQAYDLMERLIQIDAEALGFIRMQNQYRLAAVELKDAELANEAAEKFMQTPYADEPMILNTAAWNIVAPGLNNEFASAGVQDTALAVKLAERAAKLTNHENPDILDTLARAYFVDDQPAKALETQRQAVDMLGEDSNMLEQFEQRLEEYEAAVEDSAS